MDRSANPVHQAMQAAAERYGADAPDLISAAARAVINDSDVPDVVKQRLNSSHCWPDVLYLLASQAGELEEFLRLSKIDPTAAAKRISGIETLIDAAQLPYNGSVQ